MIAWQDWQQWPATWGQQGARLFAQAGQQRRLIVAINLLLVLVLSYSLADLSWRLVPAVQQPAMPVDKAAGVAAPKQQPILNVARWHLFGQYDAAPVTAPSRQKNMPETRLKLVLRGVFAGDDNGSGGAIIAAPTGKQQFYSLGDDLPGGAVLKEVHARHIVLLRNGQLETLRLPTDKLKGMASGVSSRDRVSARQALGRSSRQPQRSLREYRDTLLTNPQQLADVIQARPYRRDGIRGFKINPGRDVALFSRLGLEPNDVITAINGIRLDNPVRSLSVLQTLKQEGPVMVELLRGGVMQTLSVDINQ